VVAVGNELYRARDCKTFHDFLTRFLKEKLGPTWGNAEIAKPLVERHPVLQWYDAVCRTQQSVAKAPGEIVSAVMTGAIVAYYGLAYHLYLLAHNAELQERLIRRLKNPASFHGSYYETMVAAAFIKAGFKIELEDETDSSTTHGEFIAVARNGMRYW